MANVIIYTTPTCVYCKMAKEFFTQNNIEFTEKNVAEDDIALSEMQQKANSAGESPNGVPLIDINGQIFAGFDKKKISSALNL